MNQDFISEKLDNGLRIFLREIHAAPIVSHWVWYRVGSRDEVSGQRGLSHWVEHMQFKGTPKWPGSLMERSIARVGGEWNAFTHLDWTTFYETLPANQLEIALSIEADRMRNSIYESNEFEFERSVILSEKEGKDNDPFARLNTAVVKAAFSLHPYQNDIIGTDEDLHHIQLNDLDRHYQNYYQPANALIAIAGDFESQIILEKIKQLYQSYPLAVISRPTIKPEMKIESSKEILMYGPGDMSFIQVAYRSPAAADPDFFAYTILDSLLSGPSSLNMFGGGGISNRTSRLYRRLVEKEYAVAVSGGLQATIDPYVYDLSITLQPLQAPEIVLKKMDEEIEHLLTTKVKGKTIDRAIKQAAALFAYGLESVTNQAFWIGYSEMFANYSWFNNYLDRLRDVHPRHVLEVAQKYLHPENRVVGFYQPETAKEG